MNDEMPTISVGLPVYNGERYLEEAIKSILAQTYTDFELIISDNGSVDRTQAICKTFADQDRRIRYYRNAKNLGAAPNYNRVFELSRGAYFKWAAYDDLIDSNFLSKCLDALEEHPEAVLCYPKVNLINEFGETYNTYDPEPDISSPYPQIRLRNLMFTSNLWTYTYGLIRSTSIKKTSLHGSYPSSDEVFLFELLLQGNFLAIPERLFNLRVHTEQSTVGVMQVERNRSAWFNTSLEGKLVLPKWLYFIGCLKAIQNAPIKNLEELYCLLLMGRWLLIPAHLRAMGKDILIAGNTIIRRLFNKQ